jgi:hypothetical protein
MTATVPPLGEPALPRLAGTLPPAPVCWADLDPEVAERHRAALADWVAWLTRRYHLDQREIPTCWPQHGALIEELSALHIAWISAYHRTAPGDAPLVWHHAFHGTRQRLAEWVAGTGCRPGLHHACHSKDGFAVS